MFIGVYEKLERAGYFLNNLKALAKDAGGFPYITKRIKKGANLDGFFFEVVSAKDFFLQGINDKYGKLLPKDECTTRIGELKRLLTDKDSNASKVVAQIQSLLSRKNSWLWRLNNYRNSATHRELLHSGHEVKFNFVTNNKALLDKIKQGKVVIKPILEGQEEAIPPDVPRVDLPPENVKTYLFRDPEDPSQGNADMEVIPYCEQSLRKMMEFLDKLYSKLGI